MESSPGRRCPNCGTPVAQRADTCLMCGALLKERKKRSIRLPQGDLWLPLFVVVAIALVWLWKPWEAREPQAMVSATASVTPTATPLPTATRPVAPTATPLYSPTPPPTATLPPNQTRHVVQAGETVATIARKYGATTAAILEANGLKERTLIHPGDELIIPLPLADTPTPTPTLTPSPTPFIYKIKSGDTLSAIAKRFGTTVEVLMEVNGITDATNLRVGAELTIMQPPDFTATMAYEIYEVEQGDTLISISAKYNVTVGQIREANGLEGNNLRVGQELRIPVGTATPTPTVTPAPTLTPTPGPPRPAPALLAPPDGTAFQGADAAILLNWASVGILDKDEWYVVRLQRVDESAEQPPSVWTKATSWRLPADLYIAGLDEPQQFRWEVRVIRQTGEAEDGTQLGEEISPPGDVRTFSWK